MAEGFQPGGPAAGETEPVAGQAPTAVGRKQEVGHTLSPPGRERRGEGCVAEWFRNLPGPISAGELWRHIRASILSQRFYFRNTLFLILKHPLQMFGEIAPLVHQVQYHPPTLEVGQIQPPPLVWF